MPARRTALVLLPLLGIVLLTFRDYGVTWDEPDHRDYGRIIVHYWQTGFRDLPRVPEFSIYGGAFDGLAMWIADASPLGLWPTRHLLNALVGLAGIAGTMAAGEALAGPATGLIAGVLLALTPAWWGHMFNNPKDIPFAAAHIWAIALLIRWLKGWPDITTGLVLKTGVAIGLALGSRIGGVVLLGYLGLVTVWPARSPADDGISKVLPLGLTTAAISWAVMMVCWPEAQKHPIDWPYETLTNFLHYYPLKFSVLFKGQMYFADNLPWSYLPGYLWITLPELVLLGLAGALALAAVKIGSRDPSMTRADAGSWGLVAVSAGLPLVMIIAMHSVVYNGIRHVLFVVPPLCVLAAGAIGHAMQWLAGRRVVWRIAAGALAAGWLAVHARSLIEIHPHEYIWYNAIPGGLHGAFMKYELDYWGNAYPEALTSLMAATHGGRAPSGRKFRVAACGAPRALQAQLPETFEFVDDQRDADFLVGLVGIGCGEMRPGPAISFVVRDNVGLAYVRRLRPGT